MCLIIVNPNAVQLQESVLHSVAQDNPDGLGIYWLDTKDIVYSESEEYTDLLEKRPYIAHFRWASVGKKSDDMMHPFHIRDDLYLMHNGTVSGLGDSKLNESDTFQLAQLLAECPQQTWERILGTYDSRFVIFHQPTGQYKLFNSHRWVDQFGCKLSKKYFEPYQYRYQGNRPAASCGYGSGNSSSRGLVQTTPKQRAPEDFVNKHLVAVYGTLKKGRSNHEGYLSSATFLGHGKSVQAFPMVVDALPFVYNKPGVGHNIEVEVYSVSQITMERLDRLESHPNWYCREKTEIQLDNGGTKTCWMYLMDESFAPAHHVPEQFVSSY